MSAATSRRCKRLITVAVLLGAAGAAVMLADSCVPVCDAPSTENAPGGTVCNAVQEQGHYLSIDIKQAAVVAKDVLSEQIKNAEDQSDNTNTPEAASDAEDEDDTSHKKPQPLPDQAERLPVGARERGRGWYAANEYAVPTATETPSPTASRSPSTTPTATASPSPTTTPRPSAAPTAQP